MSDDRSLQPTAKRRKQARQEGRVAVSSQVVGAIIWLSMAAITLALGKILVVKMRAGFERIWSEPWNLGRTTEISERFQESLVQIGLLLLPAFGFIFCLAVLGRLAQVGFLWAPSRLQPDLNRSDLGKRAADLFSAPKLILILRGMGFICGALLLAGWGIWQQRASLLGLLVVADFEQELIRVLAKWGLWLGGCLSLFAILDYAHQRYRFEMSLQMSPEEMRSEIKAVEGNPHVTAGRKSLQQDIRLNRSTPPHES